MGEHFAALIAPFLSGAGGAGFGLWLAVKTLESRLNGLERGINRAHDRIDNILGIRRNEG